MFSRLRGTLVLSLDLEAGEMYKYYKLTFLCKAHVKMLQILRFILHYINILIIIGGFLSLIFQVFAFYHVLLSVIPTPWTHMVLDALPCCLIWLY